MSTAPATRASSHRRIMVLCDRYPSDMSSGRYLRVNHLCRELLRVYPCYFVDFAGSPNRPENGAPLAFADCRSLEKLPGNAPSPLRHFRASDGRFLERSWPGYFRRTVSALRGLAQGWRIDAIVSFAPNMGELAMALDLPCLLDWPDSESLTVRRALDNRGREMSWAQRQRVRLHALRQAGRERRLLRGYDLTMTIGEPDRRQLLRVSGVPGDRVVLVQNGVSENAIAAGKLGRQRSRSVVFWGSLDFPPNWTAVRYFNDEVFIPYLADAGVEWYIYGRGAGPELERIARHPQVRLEGFRADLFEQVRGCGLMVNPMVEGSGLKNKVLEAFAIRLPVVSTSLGVEAIPVQPGRECAIADTPANFAAAVLGLLDDDARAEIMTQKALRLVEEGFTWEAVGQKLIAAVRRLTAPDEASPVSAAPRAGTH